jgi:hypothetical protein
MLSKFPRLSVSTILRLHITPKSKSLDEIASQSGLSGSAQLANIMLGDERLRLSKVLATAAACGISAGLLEISSLAEGHPLAHQALEDAWSEDLTENEKGLLDIYRACGSVAEVLLDLEASDRVAVALIHGCDGA